MGSQSGPPKAPGDTGIPLFSPRAEIPPPYFNRPYFLAPSGKSQKAYQLLARVMEETGRAAVGTFVMRGHQYLVAILSDGNILRAERSEERRVGKECRSWWAPDH